MLPKNVSSVLIRGLNLESVLFKCAFFYAEQGLRVWFISPRSFEELPKEVVAPNRDVLKLITFLYLEDYTDLIDHTNGIHNWHHVPNVIILNNYEHYCSLTQNFDNLRTAFVTSSLLDAASTCSHKHSKPALLLVCHNNKDFILNYRLKILTQMYFQHLVEVNDSCKKNDTVDSIIRLANIL